MISVTANMINKIEVSAAFKTVVNEVALPVTVENSDQSYSVQVQPGGTLVLPDIDFTDSDGQTNQIPSVKDIVSTLCTVQSGIVYQRPLNTGQKTSYRTGDDAWHVVNGTHDITYPVFPSSYAQLDYSSANPFTTLLNNNAFGNKNRFTDENGGQGYANNYAVDNLTGLGWYLPLQGPDTWNNLIDGANFSNVLGFSDWRLPSRNELHSIASHDTNVSLNYSPFNIGNGSPYYIFDTSTTTQFDSNNVFIYVAYSGAGGTTPKTQSNRYGLYCRNHFN